MILEGFTYGSDINSTVLLGFIRYASVGFRSTSVPAAMKSAGAARLVSRCAATAATVDVAARARVVPSPALKIRKRR